MLRSKTAILAASLAASLLAATSANAFQIATPSAAKSSPGSVSAFSGQAAGASEGAGLLLTQDEVMHIQWCAIRFKSYHPVDNTFAGTDGKRVACQSPF